MATNVYVDAFNLYYGSLKGTPYRWLDLGAFCARLLPKDRINRIRYFTSSFLDGFSRVPCAGAAALNRVGEWARYRSLG